MPPPGFVRSQSARAKAAELFVDREEPREIFGATLDEIIADPPGFRMLTFYGVGGQGKSALCQELLRIAKADLRKASGIAPALIDLRLNRPKGEIHAWVTLRNAIAGATGARFPCFDLAYADYMQLALPDTPPALLGATRLAGIGADAKESTADTASKLTTDAIQGLFGQVGDLLAETAGSIPFAGPLIKRTTKWGIDKGYREYLVRNKRALENLYRDNPFPDANTIAAALPDILAHEFALHGRKHPEQRLVLLIDEYENALPAGGADHLSFAEAPGSWDRGLRQFIQCCCSYSPGNLEAEPNGAGLLLVLFGREKIRWDELDPAWAPDLDGVQHLLLGLGDNDADEFLRRAGVAEDEVRATIVAVSKASDPAANQAAVYPIMLDLCVQIYEDLKARGRQPTPMDFSVESSSYINKRGELLHRFLRDYDVSFRAILHRLACCREFTRALATELVRRHASAFDMAHFERLTHLSFVSPAADGDAWLIHQHIADTLLHALGEAARVETHRTLMDWFLASARPSSLKTLSLAHAEALGDAMLHAARARVALPSLDKPFRELMRWPPAQPTLLAAAQGAVAILTRNPPPDPMVLVQAQRLAATMLSYTGQVTAALPLLEEALAVAELHAPSDSTEIARLFTTLASVYAADSNARLAKQFGALAVERWKAAAGDDSLDLARSLDNLGIFYMEEFALNDAGRCFEAALAIWQHLLPSGSLEIADARTSLGCLALYKDDYAEAALQYEKALEIQRAALPDAHPDIAATLTNLAVAREQQGRLHEAWKLQEHAFAVRQAALPADHPDLAFNLVGFADLHQRNGNAAAAVPLLERALELRCDGLPANHPLIATSMDRLATVLLEVDRFDDAVRYYEAALAIRRAKLVSGHCAIAHSISNLAWIQAEAKVFDRALELQQEAIDMLAATLPAGHADIGLGWETLAVIRHRAGDLAGAVKDYGRAAAILRAALGNNAPALAGTLTNTAKARFAIGDLDDARRDLAEALAIKRSAYGPNHPDAAALSALADSWDRLSRGDPSAPSLRWLQQQAAVPGTVSESGAHIPWFDISGDQAEPYLAFLRANGALPEDGSFAAREAALAFYPDLTFLELTGPEGKAYILFDRNSQGEDSWFWLDMTNAPIYAANARYLRLNERNVVGYVGFFFSAVAGPYGLMPIIETAEGIDAEDEQARTLLEELAPVLPPRLVVEDASHLTVAAAMLFQGAIFSAKLKVSRLGFVEVTDLSMVAVPEEEDHEDEEGEDDNRRG